MKKIITLLLLAAVVGCSKSNDATPAASGCSVSFKGTTYSFPIAICVDAGTGGSTVDGLTATETTGTKAFIIARDSADPTSNSLSLSLAVGTAGSQYLASVANTSQPTINRTGKSWTFSGTASNGLGDSGAISGTCTCTN